MSKLCPQRNFEIQVASAEHMPSAERLLRDVLLDTEPLISSPAELMLRFPTVRSEVELAELLQKLVAAKLPVTQFRELTSDLEDAFLSVAGKE
jgi:ABC-2 type transport system ATP-binding protein